MENQNSQPVSVAEANALLDQAIAAIDIEANDPHSAISKDIDNDPEAARQAISNFKSAINAGVLKFTPVLAGVQKLVSDSFAAHNVAKVAGVEQLMQMYDFYLIPFPVTAFPAPGSNFARVFAQIELDPDAKAVFYSLFPSDEYLSVLQGESHLNIGVGANLKLTASANKSLPTNPLASASGQGAANVDGDTGGKLVVGPFSYNIRRPLVTGRGEGDVTAIWMLDSNQRIEGAEPLQFLTVVQVPKGTTKLAARGQLQGFLKANIGAQMGDFFKVIGEKLKGLFGGEQPLQPEPVVWQNVLEMAAPLAGAQPPAQVAPAGVPQTAPLVEPSGSNGQ